MDRQLRARPNDVNTLMRAGRLSRDRVAMAAYLGDLRALEAGVEPWQADEPPGPWQWPVRFVLRYGPLTPRQRVGLVGICAEHAPLSGTGRKTMKVVWRWCRGEATAKEVSAATGIVGKRPRRGDLSEVYKLVEGIVTGNTVLAIQSYTGVTLPASAGEARVHQEAKQAELIAEALLDPAWLPEAIPVGS